ncbi:hypothetical protein SUDANB6_04692 [Streptomyces sp. enrichment culture]|uniref:hypothetical protein n=1 Tax=Streptomyces sp. enrichment culture TaxID=1795815 RepID=UPI003F57AB7D
MDDAVAPAEAAGTGPGTGAETDPEAERAPAPLHVPRTPTGNAEVDAHLERLADADHLATDGHVEVYEDVHRGLRDALAALDARPGPLDPTGRPAATPRRGPSGHESDSTHDRRS